MPIKNWMIQSLNLSSSSGFSFERQPEYTSIESYPSVASLQSTYVRIDLIKINNAGSH